MTIKILSFVPKKSRIPFLQTSKKSLHFGLKFVWCPWHHDGRGLVFACMKGFVDYYEKWMAISYALKMPWRPIVKDEVPQY